MNIAVLGASSNREKFGNKCVRAYASQGHHVFPINPKEKEIEGIHCYPSINEIQHKIDAICLYLPPVVTKTIVSDIIHKMPKLVYFNPGTEDKEIEEKLKANGITPLRQCAIVAIGLSPSDFP